jgi:hypothetical protein
MLQNIFKTCLTNKGLFRRIYKIFLESLKRKITTQKNGLKIYLIKLEITISNKHIKKYSTSLVISEM